MPSLYQSPEVHRCGRIHKLQRNYRVNQNKIGREQRVGISAIIESVAGAEIRSQVPGIRGNGNRV